jgi:hypothetical protein
MVAEAPSVITSAPNANGTKFRAGARIPSTLTGAELITLATGAAANETRAAAAPRKSVPTLIFIAPIIGCYKVEVKTTN